MLKIAVFVSGRGSNLQAILKAKSNNYLNIEVKALISDKLSCKAVEIANENQIPVYFVSLSEKENFISFEQLAEILKKNGVNLVVLAGFLKKIPDDFVEHFENKIINIHPALLPSFGGKGMYGMNVHQAVFDSSAKVSGVTVHFVDKVYDNGKIIAQQAVDISDVESPEEIADRVLKVEHELLPYVIKMIDEDKVVKIGNRIVINNSSVNN